MSEYQADRIIELMELLQGIMGMALFYLHVIAYALAFLAGGVSLAVVAYAVGRRNFMCLLVGAVVLCGSVARADDPPEPPDSCDGVIHNSTERARVWTVLVAQAEGTDDLGNPNTNVLGDWTLTWNQAALAWIGTRAVPGSGGGPDLMYQAKMELLGTEGLPQTRIIWSCVTTSSTLASHRAFHWARKTPEVLGHQSEGEWGDIPGSLTIYPVDCCPDADGDGICDDDDPCPYDADNECLSCEVDSDGDGIPDCSDPCPYDASNTCPENCTADTDGDGIPDCYDPCPEDPLNQCGLDCEADTDGDGLNDCDDPCPYDASNQCDEDPGCPGDQDCDGCPDYLDPQPTNPAVGCEWEPEDEPPDDDDPGSPPPTYPDVGNLPPYWWAASLTWQALQARLPTASEGAMGTRLWSATTTLPCPGGPGGVITMRFFSDPFAGYSSSYGGAFMAYDSVRRLVRSVLAMLVAGQFGLAVWRALRQY